jgi:hypothetical protein
MSALVLKGDEINLLIPCHNKSFSLYEISEVKQSIPSNEEVVSMYDTSFSVSNTLHHDQNDSGHSHNLYPKEISLQCLAYISQDVLEV